MKLICLSCIKDHPESTVLFRQEEHPNISLLSPSTTHQPGTDESTNELQGPGSIASNTRVNKRIPIRFNGILTCSLDIGSRPLNESRRSSEGLTNMFRRNLLDILWYVSGAEHLDPIQLERPP
jgi:hypothetical protein